MKAWLFAFISSLALQSAFAQKMEPAVQPEAVDVEERQPLAQNIQATPPALKIELPPPEPPQQKELEDEQGPQATQVGIHRQIPAQYHGDLSPYLSSGSIEVTSSGAQSIRIALTASLPDGGKVVFSDTHGEVIYALEAHELPSDGGLVWSPVVDGATLRVEFQGAGSNASLSIEKVAHIGPLSEAHPELECQNHINAQCRLNAFPEGQEGAIVKMIYEERRGTFACSGTLMNERAESLTPYVLTADHCINTPAEAASVSARWFFKTRSCRGVGLDSRSSMTHGGATLLATSPSDDMSLIRLKNKAPGGTIFAGWDPAPVNFDTEPDRPVHVLSHPGGGVMKYTGAKARSEYRYILLSGSVVINGVSAHITDGAIESGSSGGGVFDDQFLIGVASAISAEDPQCSSSAFQFGAFHRFFAQIEKYLDPPPELKGTLAFVRPADSPTKSVIRLASKSDKQNEVSIQAWDDEGTSYGPLELVLHPERAISFDSDELEQGSSSKGLGTGIGDGEGAWRLAVKSEYPMDIASYIRADDGLLVPMHDLVPETKPREYSVPFFAPHGTWNRRLRSWLRIANPNNREVEVTIAGLDDRGGDSRGKASLTLPPLASVLLSAEQLETGDSSLDGRLENGAGNWRLSVSATRPVWLMNILESSTGEISNISLSASSLAGSEAKDETPEPIPTPPPAPDPNLIVPPAPVFFIGLYDFFNHEVDLDWFYPLATAVQTIS